MNMSKGSNKNSPKLTNEIITSYMNPDKSSRSPRYSLAQKMKTRISRSFVKEQSSYSVLEVT